jgi:pimeloyl-ACP methyl ester carboxylesterase
MPHRTENGPHPASAADPETLLVLVPGMGMTAGDPGTESLISAAEERYGSILIMAVDPGFDGYLDGSVETRLLATIAQARRDFRPKYVWLAGISLGCQALLRCIKLQPDLAQGLILITPYLASTGLIAEIARAGSLRKWSITNRDRTTPERVLMTWLTQTPMSKLPQIFVGRAAADRFVMTATLIADILPADRVVTVPGAHDWVSWKALWRLILDRQPFGLHRAVNS